jgi:hypothetical protein
MTFADQNPLLYKKPLPPIVWEYFPFHSIPETPMHLMMGVVKAVNSLVYDWAVSNNQGPDFVLTLNRCITLLHTFAWMAWYVSGVGSRHVPYVVASHALGLRHTARESRPSRIRPAPNFTPALEWKTMPTVFTFERDDRGLEDESCRK